MSRKNSFADFTDFLRIFLVPMGEIWYDNPGIQIIIQEDIIVVNRFVLNAMSYHGKGAIKEIPGLVAAKGLKKAFVASDPDLV